MKNNFLIYLLITVAIIAFWDSIFFYPIKIFVVYLHESSHALATILTGGQVRSISISPDESGYCESMGGIKWIIIPAGYIGSMIFGCLIFIFSMKNVKVISYFLSICMLILTILFVKNTFGFIIGISFPIILFITYKINIEINKYFVQIIGLICIIYSIIDIKDDLIMNTISGSDACAMSQYIPLPPFIWGLIWMIISGVIAYKTIKYTFK